MMKFGGSKGLMSDCGWRVQLLVTVPCRMERTYRCLEIKRVLRLAPVRFSSTLNSGFNIGSSRLFLCLD
jgi:hypothetical protein